jgi:hypothetical protein
MKKNKTKDDRDVMVRFSRKQYELYKEIFNSIGINTSEKDQEIEKNDVENEKDLIRAKAPQGQEFYDVFYENMDFDSWVPPVGLGQTFFQNSTIPDAFLLDYIGSRISLRDDDFYKLYSFFYDALGFPEDFTLNKDSNLVRLLAMYSRY